MSVQVTALSAIAHDGKEYAEGDTLEVSQEQADALIQVNAAKRGRAEAAKEAEVVETPASDPKKAK